jgi:hypothetical protein
MTKAQRKAVLANFVAGLTPEAIATALGVPLSEVRAVLRKPAPAEAAPDAPAAEELPEWMRKARADAARDRAIAAAQRARHGTDRSRHDAAEAREAGGVQSFGGGCFFIRARSRRTF